MLFIIKYLRLIAGMAAVAALLAPGFVSAQKLSRAAPFPEASEEVYGIGSGGKLYVFGGLGPAYTPKGLVYEYDPANDTWTKKKNMPQPSHHVGLTELNGKIYLIGGFVKPIKGPPAWEPIDNVWEYDPATDNWRALAPLPKKRGAAVAAVHNGKIYAIGGAGAHPGSKETSLLATRPHRALGTNEVYDPATNTWQTLQDMPTARNHGAIGVVNGKIYYIGGRIGAAFITANTQNVDTVEEYDPATDQWGFLKAPMPTPRSAVGWGVHNGKIYVAGGEVRNQQISATYRVVEVFDPVANTWTSTRPMQFARHGLAATIIGGRFHLVSGNAQSGGAPGTHIASDVHEVLELGAK